MASAVWTYPRTTATPRNHKPGTHPAGRASGAVACLLQHTRSTEQLERTMWALAPATGLSSCTAKLPPAANAVAPAGSKKRQAAAYRCSCRSSSTYHASRGRPLHALTLSAIRYLALQVLRI